MRKVEDSVWKYAALLFACVALGLTILGNLWVCDDAYITFRTIENFVNGDGLRWNPAERVQSYTHPLWLFIQVPFFWLTREPFLTVAITSVMCCLGVLVAVVRIAGTRPLLGVATIVIPLIQATAFIEYTSSGLENPLTFFFLALLALALVGKDESTPSLMAVTLLAGFAALNRLDSILLFAPAVALVCWKNRRKHPVSSILPGVVLVLAWESFSLLYYGVPFPNTWYAKVTSEIPRLAYIQQGLLYGVDLIIHHPASAMLLLSGCVAGAARIAIDPRMGANDKHLPTDIALASGVVLYALYIVWVGGDFMSGRFWAAPVFLSSLVLFRCVASLLPEKMDGYALVAIPLLMLSVRFSPPAVYTLGPFEHPLRTGIAPEREFYALHNSLAALSRGNGPASSAQGKYGLALRELGEQAHRQGASLIVIQLGKAGVAGFYAGPTVICVDEVGLGDALLARLPPTDTETWRIGHLQRDLPPGYEQALRTGSPESLPDGLRQYYERLVVLTRAPLLAPGRLRTVVEFNLGHYDHLLDQYAANLPPPE